MHPEAVTPHIANLAREKGFTWLQTGKLRQDEYTRGALHKWLREKHNIDVCFRPSYFDGTKTYFIYIIRPQGELVWACSDFATLELALEAAFEAALNLTP